MITKEERRKRLIEDFRKVAEHRGSDIEKAVEFAKNIPDETLDYFEKLGYSSEKKVRVESDIK